jgi:hypothetical protein
MFVYIYIYIYIHICVQVSRTTCRAGPLDVGLKNLCPRTLFPFPTSSLGRIFNMYLVYYTAYYYMYEGCSSVPRTRRCHTVIVSPPHRASRPHRYKCVPIPTRYTIYMIQHIHYVCTLYMYMMGTQLTGR